MMLFIPIVGPIVATFLAAGGLVLATIPGPISAIVAGVLIALAF